jgi:hypothetical protein
MITQKVPAMPEPKAGAFVQKHLLIAKSGKR